MQDNHADFLLANAMINKGLLEEINAPRIKELAPTGAVLISCGDRDRFRYHFGDCNTIVDVHPLCLNGGGVLLGDEVDPIRRTVLLEDCLGAFAIKRLSFVLNLSHFPCGKCAALGLGLRKTILKTLQGKTFLKREIPAPTLRGVLPLISIDWRSASVEGQDGVKLYATHLKDMETITSFGNASVQGT